MAARRPAFELDRHTFFWLTQVTGARDRALARELRPFGLRVPEWRALAALYSRRSCTMSEVAELASIDRTTLSRTVDRMQEAGWLARENDAQDMRVVRVALTAAGERLFAWVWPTVARLNRRALAGLSEAAVESLRRSLERMKANLEAPDSADERAA